MVCMAGESSGNWHRLVDCCCIRTTVRYWQCGCFEQCGNRGFNPIESSSEESDAALVRGVSNW